MRKQSSKKTFEGGSNFIIVRTLIIYISFPLYSYPGAKHNEVLGWYRMNWRRLKLPPLYAEIYDVPKSDDAPANGHINVTSDNNAIPQSVTPLSVSASYPPDIKVPVNMMGLSSNGT